MHKVAYSVICVMVASLLAGCGDAPTTKANAELRAAIDVARRHCLRAAGAMGVLPEASAPNPRPVVRENPDVLAALADAEKTLTTALAAADDAGREIRAVAQQLLADVHRAAGQYRDLLVRGRTAALTAQQQRVAGQAARLGRVGALRQAMRSFLALSDDSRPEQASPVAAELKIQAAEQVAALDAEIADLQDRVAGIRRRIDTLQAKVEQHQAQATALRQQIVTATGMMVLELDERASVAEAVVEEAEGEISVQEVALQETDTAIDRRQLQRGAARQLLASVDAWMNGLEVRREVVSGHVGELEQRVAKHQAELASLADDLAEQFTALLAEGEAALASCRKAADANMKAAALFRQLRQDTQAARADQSNSPMMPVLESRSSQALLGPVTAQAGDVALLSASLQHHLVEVHADLARLQGRVDGLCRQAGLSAPDRLAVAAEVAAKMNTFAEQADQQYQAAGKAFNDVAERMLARSPVNTKDTDWLYKGAQARALYGRYRLAVLRNEPEAASTYRDSASKLVADLLVGHQGDDVYAPIEQIARRLKGE